MQSSYPLFESGQVLTATHLNDLVAYLEQQDRLTRNKLIGIGIVCGLEGGREPATNHVRISCGCAVTSEGYLLIHEETLYTHFRTYTLPTAQVEEATETLPADAPYPFFHDANGNPINLWELLPAGFTAGPGEPAPTALSAAFLQNKVALLFLERNLESLKNCDIGDCSDKGAEWEFTLRALLVNRADAQAMLDREAQIAQRPVDRRNHPRYGLNELRIEKINPAAHQIESFEGLLSRIYAVSNDLGPQLIDALNKSYDAFRYLLAGMYPASAFPNGPFGGATYFARVVSQLMQNIFLGQYFYAYLVDVVRAYNEFLRAAMRIDAECCPHPGRFPLHVLLGEVTVRPAAFAGNVNQPGFNPLSANGGFGATTRPAGFRHHFVPSPLFDRQDERLHEVRSLHYRLYLLAIRYTTDGLMDAEIRLTPSKEGDVQLSDQAIPYYYALLANKENDDLVRNWSYAKTMRNRLDRLFSYRYINNADHPLRYRMDDHNFCRVEGAVGKALSTVMQTLIEQKRQLGLSFAIEPVYIGLSMANDLNSRELDRETQLRAQQALIKLLVCRMRDLDVVFLILMAALFQYLTAIITALSRTNTLQLVGLASPTRLGDVQSATGPATELNLVVPGARLSPKVAQSFRRTTEAMLKELRPQAYLKGTITGRVTQADDPRAAIGKFYEGVKEAPSTANLFDRTLEYVRELNIDVEPEVVSRRLYPVVSLLDKTEELVAVVSAPSLADFDFREFEVRYDGFVQAFESYLAQVQTQPDEPTSPLRQTHQLVAAHYGSIAATTPQAVLTGLASELRERINKIFAELMLGAYAQRHPGMEHKGGVPEGGTLVLLYTHRSLLTRVVREHQQSFASKTNDVRTKFASTSGAASMPDPREVLVARQAEAEPLDEFVVLADFCLPYLCCDSDCSDIDLSPGRNPPPPPPPPAPTGTLKSACVGATRTWTATVSQSGSYVAEFLVGGTVASSISLKLTANTPQTFAYSGDPTTLSAVRITLGGATIATESGPFAPCRSDPVPPPQPAPTGTLRSECVGATRTWTVNVSQEGTYSVHFLRNDRVIDSFDLELSANKPRRFTFNGEATELSEVRILFKDKVIASERGPFERCQPSGATLRSKCVRNKRVWTVTVPQDGKYLVHFLIEDKVVATESLELKADQEHTFTFSGDPTTLSAVRIIFEDKTIASERGPFEKC